MEWNVNKFIFAIRNCALCLFIFGGSLIPLFFDLDPEKWDDLRKGMDYTEAPPLEFQPSQDTIAPLGLGVWMEMVKIFGIILLVGLLIYLIVKLILNSKGSKKSTQNGGKEILPNEKMPTALSPMETLWSHFENAKGAGDYRECLRILYQISLKELGQKGWVKTKTDKTNREYLEEIEPGEVAGDFTNLTLIHEYSWYGDTSLEKSEYVRYEPQFLKFIKNPALEKK